MPGFEYLIDRSEVLRYLGYRGQELTPEMDELIGVLSAQCVKDAEPEYHYKIFPLTHEGRPMLAGCGLRLLGEDIRGHLSGAKSCAVMAATLGLGVERTLARLGLRSTTEQLIYNSACTALIEAVADRCEEDIRADAASRGLHTNYRYSPGYGDFPLHQQREILDAIDAQRYLGLTLTDGYMMLPRKSVSAVIGLFEEERAAAPSCDACAGRATCPYRKINY